MMLKTTMIVMIKLIQALLNADNPPKKMSSEEPSLYRMSERTQVTFISRYSKAIKW